MPTIVGHAAAALVITRTMQLGRLSTAVWCAGLLCSVMPDFDVLAFYAGIPYESAWGHRGISHSLFFALLGGFLAALPFLMSAGFLAKRFVLLWSIFTLILISHIALDAMTDGGLGVALLAPFHNTRYFLPWRPIPVAPISVIRLFGPHGRPVLLFEFLFLFVPAIVYLSMFSFMLKFHSRGIGTAR